MFLECRHIRTSGAKCQAAALKGEPYCYFHARQRTHAKRPYEVRDFFAIPPLEDRATIQVLLADLATTIIENRIDVQRAGLVIRCLTLASQNMKYKDDIVAPKAVRLVTQSEAGEELAPSVKNTIEDFTKLIGERLAEKACNNIFGPDEEEDEGGDSEDLSGSYI